MKPKQSFKRKFFENEYLTKRFEWTLFKYGEIQKRQEKEVFQAPSGQITPTFTSSLVLENLNSLNCFDFDYQPKENDLLKIEGSFVFEPINGQERESDLINCFMLFQFFEGQWNKLNSNPFFENWEEFTQGIVEMENH